MNIRAIAICCLALQASGCAFDRQRTQQVGVERTSTPAVSCETVKRLPPALIGAARSSGQMQPVLVVGCDSSG